MGEFGLKGEKWNPRSERSDLLEQPLRWRKPRRIFVCSMSDLFHPDVPDKFIDRVFAIMALAPQHTFQVLTKRPERMRAYLQRPIGGTSRPDWIFSAMGRQLNVSSLKHPGWPLPNVWLGTSVENQAAADERIPWLLQTPAAVRWLSCEPLLGPIDFRKVPGFNSVGLDLSKWWIVAGGESGPGARPMHPDWPRSIRDQCRVAGVPFLFKQWGEWAPDGPVTAEYAVAYRSGQIVKKEKGDRYRPNRGPGDIILHRVGKKKAGRLLDGQVWDQYPEARKDVRHG